MPEPISTSTATVVGAALVVPMLSVFGVPLGLRPDLLIAGFAGSLVAIVLLNSAPSEGDTLQHLLGSTVRRLFIALASSLTAGYLTPLAMLLAAIPDSLLLGAAFAVGAGAQRVLASVVNKLAPVEEGK